MNLPLQDTSLEIWQTKYQLKDKQGNPIDKTLKDTYKRVAKALAAVEPKEQDYWFDQFMWALQNGAIPAGRILSNVGAEEYKPATSTINCTVSGRIHDSMDDVLTKNKEAGLTLKAGCGIGYEFSTLRPKGAFVTGAGAYTSGPLSFMDIFDKMCFTVSSAGGRRGAQMATFDIHHPDILEFIEAKRENGRLRQFNLSLLITKDFIEAVQKKDNWILSFPVSKDEYKQLTTENIVWRKLPIPTVHDYKINSKSEIACKVYKTIPAEVIWDKIMTATYNYAEPGFILIDEVNRMNNNWWCEDIRATNPCGEQPLPPYGSCLLGSVNLTKFVKNPFSDKAEFDWLKYSTVVGIFTRMLDNVVELNNLPLGLQQEEIKAKRRHGMGFLGLGSVLAMLRMEYGSPESVEFTEQVSHCLAIRGWQESLKLSKEKGAAPILLKDSVITQKMLNKRPELKQDGYSLGDIIPNALLHINYSKYMQKFTKDYVDLCADLIEYGARFTHHSSIAPTGTISLSLANNASNGIEPSFSHYYVRNVIKEGKKTKEQMYVYSYELLAYYQYLLGQNKIEAGTLPQDLPLPSYFKTAETVKPIDHVRIQAAAQKWVDSSISKTINIPSDFPYEDFKNIYMEAYAAGLKGCTTFRFNPEAFQGVLVTDKDLENTVYQFTLEDGSLVEFKGNEQVEYDGETHTAANLFDAIKEGYYNKL